MKVNHFSYIAQPKGKHILTGHASIPGNTYDFSTAGWQFLYLILYEPVDLQENDSFMKKNHFENQLSSI